MSRLSRRRFLALSGLGLAGVALGGCATTPDRGSLPRVRPAQQTGRVVERTLRAAPMELRLADRTVQTWGYEGEVPGPELRLTEGDTLRVRLRNELPADTTIHWHGLPIENAMDGVPNVTQPPVKGGEGFTYEFMVPTAGTYLYHSHVGLQLDRGLYGALIVEPRNEELDYDREYTLVLDDWLDGIDGRTPEDANERLHSGGGSGGGMMDGMNNNGRGGGGMMGGRMVDYPLYLVNGRPARDPQTLSVRRGERVRLRLVNPGSDTLFRFAVAGHRLTVTHADGLPVEHVEVDTLRIGSGERYDVILTADNPGVWQAAAVSEGTGGGARAVVRYREAGQSSPPPPDALPGELEGRLLSYSDLRAADRDSFPTDGNPDRVHELTLSGGMGEYAWAIDGQRYPDAEPLEVAEGEWVRFQMSNRSPIAHPMHLHGHFFQLRTEGGGGPFKDTVLVEPHMGEATFDFVADNPGDWFFHCHLTYHMENGMARVMEYA